MFGRNFTGRDQRQGMGLGFRGESPPWPYVGRGRGGLPRCSYPGLTGTTGNFKSSASEADLGVLKRQAEAARQQLRDMESRIQELEKKEDK